MLLGAGTEACPRKARYRRAAPISPPRRLRAIGHRRDTPSTGAWLPGAHAVERAAVPGDIGRGNPGGIIGGAMIRGPARPGFALILACGLSPAGTDPCCGECYTARRNSPTA